MKVLFISLILAMANMLIPNLAFSSVLVNIYYGKIEIKNDENIDYTTQAIGLRKLDGLKGLYHFEDSTILSLDDAKKCIEVIKQNASYYANKDKAYEEFIATLDLNDQKKSLEMVTEYFKKQEELYNELKKGKEECPYEMIVLQEINPKTNNIDKRLVTSYTDDYLSEKTEPVEIGYGGQ